MLITETSKVILQDEDGRYALDDMQDMIDGYIEVVRLGPVLPTGRILDMVINDEGKLQGMPRNALATVLAQNAGAISPDDYIAGPALLTATDDEGDSHHLTAEEEQKVLEMIRAVG